MANDKKRMCTDVHQLPLMNKALIILNLQVTLALRKNGERSVAW